MDKSRLSDYLSFIKQQIASQEVLLEYHLKIEAMIEMILANNLTDFSKEKVHNYLWIISDLVCKAKEFNRGLLDTLNKTMSGMPI